MSQQRESYHRKLLVLGAVLGLLAIILGAFASHGLKKIVSPEEVEVFRTGVRFQFYHTFFALIIGSLGVVSNRAKNLIFYFTLTGVLFFSGSIYGLATNVVTSFDFTKIALITPIGGVFLIAAWITLLVNLLKIKNK